MFCTSHVEYGFPEHFWGIQEYGVWFCRAALTSLLGPSQPMEGVVVPGSKSTKYKRERDLVGLSGDQVKHFLLRIP